MDVEETKARLLAIAGDRLKNRKILDINIVCENLFEFDYSFSEESPNSIFDWSMC